MFQLADGSLRRWSGKVLRRVCSMCGDGRAQANFRDEDGSIALCGKHARKRGTYAALNPCVDCPPDRQRQSSYHDENGKIEILILQR